MGPTGTGKTALANAMARFKNGITVFHMQQYNDSVSVSSMFGSAAGYIGSDDKPQFALALEKIRNAVEDKNPGERIVRNVVILFDEIEKAHYVVKQSLLTLIDEGRIILRYTEKDRNSEQSKNQQVSYIFENCSIIMTSNLFQRNIVDNFQKGASVEETVLDFKNLNQRLGKDLCFSDEFIARVTVVPFGPIPRNKIYKGMLAKKLDDFILNLKTALNLKSVEVREKDRFIEIMENNLYGDGTDVRKVDRYFEKIEKVISENLDNWVTSKKTALVLYPEKDELYMKPWAFCKVLNFYKEMPDGKSMPISIGISKF